MWQYLLSERRACLLLSLCLSATPLILPSFPASSVLLSCIGIDLLPSYWSVSSFLKPMKEEAMHVRLPEWFFLVPKASGHLSQCHSSAATSVLNFLHLPVVPPPQLLNFLLNRSSHGLYKLSAVSNSLPGPFSPNK